MKTRLQFKLATKEQSRLRMALDGPAGAGKTYTALLFAHALAEQIGGRVAVIDTEHASASKYADLFPPYDVLEMDEFSPALYTEAIRLAESAGYSVLIIDSLSHAWDGSGGALEMVDDAAARSRAGNSYTAWRDVTPLHRRMVEAILQSSCHIIATMRSKMEYIMQEETRNGRTVQVPRKVGLAPIQRQGMEYEFDIVADMDIDHRLVVSKSRCFAVADNVTLKPKGDWLQPVIAWLTSGEAVVREQEQAAQTAATGPAPHWSKDTESRKRFWAWTGDIGLTKAEVHAALGVEHVEEFNGSKSDAVAAINAYIEAHVDEGQEA
ncbi:MAG: AAA family ATPase [Anaerolineales bacterium]|nr:AAA family ATPase [Anaerolineales bacterium]